MAQINLLIAMFNEKEGYKKRLKFFGYQLLKMLQRF